MLLVPFVWLKGFLKQWSPKSVCQSYILKLGIDGGVCMPVVCKQKRMVYFFSLIKDISFNENKSSNNMVPCHWF